MALEPVGGGAATNNNYRLIGVVRGLRVNNDGTVTPIVTVTASSVTYGVQFTFTMTAQAWDTNGGPPQTTLRTEWVDAICAYDHVIGFRTEQDQGPDQILYNYGVITVGTADGAISDETRVRMDHLNDVSTFQAIDATWSRLAAAGAS